MKKYLCLLLVLALTAPMLAGCRRNRGTETADPSATGVAGDSFAPAQGPGYTITDGSTNLSGNPGETPDVTLKPLPEAPVNETLTDKEAAQLEQTMGQDGEALQEPPADDLAAVDESVGEPMLGTYDEAADEASQHDDSASSSSTPIDIGTYQYLALMDDNVDFTFNYPSHWENVPGVYTVCFREPVEPGDFPARVAITRKRLVHTPDDIALMEQMTSYIKSVYKQYDAKTFQTSIPDTEATFMGQHALANTYLAYWGDVEVKGFVIGCAVDRTLYVFHFCASYPDYVALQGVLQYMLQSAKLKNPPETKKK